MPKFGTPAYEARPNQPPSRRDKLWRAIRQLRQFDTGKVALCTEDTHEFARRFMVVLRRSGYIVPNGGRSKFRLARDTGPHAPMEMLDENRAMIGALDRNTGAAYGVDGGPAPGVSSHCAVRAGMAKQRLVTRRRKKAGAK